MHRRLMLVLVGLALATRTAAAQSKTVIVQFDHATSKWRTISPRAGGADTSKWSDRPSATLTRNDSVTVHVINTNSAVYRLAHDTTSAPLSEVTRGSSFLGRLAPYLPEVGMAVAGPARGRGDDDSVSAPRPFLSRAAGAEASIAGAALVNAAERTEDDLVRLDAALFGPSGVETQLTGSLSALEQMRTGRTTPEQAARDLRQALGIEAPDCAGAGKITLGNPQLVLATLTSLMSATSDLTRSLYDPLVVSESRWATLRDSATIVSSRAHLALAAFDTLMTNAYRVDHITRLAATACSSMNAGTIDGNGRARTLAIRIEPRGEPELARLADRGPATFSVTVRPTPRIRPFVGVSALFVPTARYSTYATRPAVSGVEVYESGVKDQRFVWGFNLGLTWRQLDWGDERGHAIWLPDVTIGNSGDAKLFGVGGGASVRFVKLGAGVLWMRHTAIDGAALGSSLPNATYLRTVDTYGKRQFYIGASLINLSFGRN